MEFQLADLWEALCDAGPEHVCLVAGDVHHTRSSLDERANRIANHLRANGVGAGDRVGIYTYNRAEHVEAMLGAWKLSAVPINVNFRYVPAELRHIWSDANLKALIFERSFTPTIAEIVNEFPQTTTHVVIDDGTSLEPTWSADGWESALAAVSPERPATPDRSADDLYVLYTGGTTGMPKGVMWRHEDIFFAAMGGGNYYDPITKPEQIAVNGTNPAMPMNMVATAPLMHAAGQWVVMIGMLTGGKVAIYCDRPFNAATLLDLVEAEECQTMSYIGDAMALPIVEELRARPRDMPNLFAVSNGGAMVSPATRVKLAEVFPGKILNDGFGSSETGTVGNGANTSNDEQGSFFAVNPTTRVLDPETLEVSQVGTPGIMARTGHIPLGYLNDPDKTAKTFITNAAGERCVMSGDWAIMGEDGRLQLLGRGSTTINSGGEKIHPEEVESACRTHSAVADVIVTGVPDERWGARVVALVETVEAEQITLEDLQTHCRATIAGYKVPRDLILCEIQHTNVGKPDTVWAREHACEALGIEVPAR